MTIEDNSLWARTLLSGNSFQMRYFLVVTQHSALGECQGISSPQVLNTTSPPLPINNDNPKNATTCFQSCSRKHMHGIRMGPPCKAMIRWITLGPDGMKHFAFKENKYQQGKDLKYYTILAILLLPQFKTNEKGNGMWWKEHWIILDKSLPLFVFPTLRLKIRGYNQNYIYSVRSSWQIPLFF